MSTTTEKYGFLKPDPNDFYDVKEDISDNMDKVEEALSEFDDSGSVEEIKNFPDFLSKFLSGNKLATTLRNLKAGLQFVLHTGQIVNNCVTDNAGLPLSAAQGKALMDKYTQLYSEVSNSGIPIVKKITDLYSIKASGFYYYDAGATNAPMSSRGGMIVANYLSDSWISLTVVPYASSKIYTNTKYNNTWVGWAESATKDDLSNFVVSERVVFPAVTISANDATHTSNVSVQKDGYKLMGVFIRSTGNYQVYHYEIVIDRNENINIGLKNTASASVTATATVQAIYMKNV